MTERKPEYFRNYRPITINWFTGWWLSLPLWKIWKSVGIIIPNIWKKCKMFQTTNQFQMIQIQEGKWKVPDIWQRPSNVVRCHLPGSPCHSHSRAKKMRSRGQRVVPMDLGALSAHIFQWIGRKFQTGNPETRDFTQTLSRRFPMISSIYVLFNQFWEICSGYMWLSPWESGTETSKSCKNFDAAPMGRWQVETTS